MPQRVLSEQEFGAIRDRVLQSAPNGLDESGFHRWIGPAMAQAIGEAESSPEQPAGSAMGRFASNAGEMLNPVSIAKGVYNTVRHPVDTAKAVGQSHLEQGRKAWELAKTADSFEDYIELAGRIGATALPVLGPAAADIGEQIGSGDVAGGFGRGTALLATVATPAAVRGVRQARPTRAQAPATVADDAVQFARARGVPMSVGQSTGNPVARGIEQLNERTSIGGSIVTRNARQQQATALATVGDDLARQVSPSPVMAEQAGQGVRDSVTARAAAYDAAADTAYATLRAAETRRAAVIARTGGVQSPATSARPFTQTPLAVDIAPTKTAMTPIYEALKRESELVPLMGDKGRALTALDRLMRAPDMAPLSVADSALGDLKSISRVDQAFRRTAGQGVAAETVKNLDAAVRAAATQAGPDVLKALMDGRAATVNKFKTIDVLDKLRTEPVQVFNQATYAKDAGVGTLREIARVAPNELPKVGRAFLDDLLTTATSEGGFGHTQAIATKWQNLGPQTKRLLFTDPALIKDLDNFFLFAKKAGENLNPSGSAFVGTLSAKGAFTVMNPATGIPLEIGQTALSKLLWSPTVVRLLNRSLTTPVKARGSAQRIVSELTKELAKESRFGAVVPTGRDSMQPAQATP